MPVATKTGSSLSDIASRAALRKVNPNLRHTPNEHDIRIASEHANLMAYHQYNSINANEDDN